MSKYLKRMQNKESLMRMEVMNAFEVKKFKKGERISRKAVDNDNVSIHFHFYSTNSKVQLHKHTDSVDIYYVIEGEGLVTIGNEETVLRKGDIVAIPKNTVHGVVNPYKKPLIMLDILAPKPKT
ncbi:MAG: cupin domain-containing protein [Candidatus Bathycorpusculaceae bacterium]